MLRRSRKCRINYCKDNDTMGSMKMLFVHLTVMMAVLLYSMNSTTATPLCTDNMTECTNSSMRERRELPENLSNVQPNAGDKSARHGNLKKKQLAPSERFRRVDEEAKRDEPELPAPGTPLNDKTRRGIAIAIAMARRSGNSQAEQLVAIARRCCRNKDSCQEEKAAYPRFETLCNDPAIKRYLDGLPKQRDDSPE